MDLQTLEFPIFTIESEELQEKIEEAIELKNDIDVFRDELEEIKSEMETSGKKLNFYVNNIINYEKKFNYKNNVIIFDEQKNLYLYAYKDVKRLGFEADEETLSTKKALHIQKITTKQIERCLDLIMIHNDIYCEYEDIKEDYNDTIHDYYELIEEAKEIVSENKIENDDENIVPFNSDLHELLMVKFKDEEWKFIYFEKQYKDTLLESLNENEKEIIKDDI